MNAPAIVYDITRLATRFSRPAPNGIDRVDLAYARHFLSAGAPGQGGLLNPTGPRLVAPGAARQLVSAIEQNWSEAGDARRDPVFHKVLDFLSNDTKPPPPETGRTAQPASITHKPLAHKPVTAFSRYAFANKVAGRDGLFPGRSLARCAPPQSVYINTSQFPLWVDWYFKWLDSRPDIRAVFFVHDLLPLSHPEFFPPAEEARHRKRIEVLAKRATGVIVASKATQSALKDHLNSIGMNVPPIAVIPLPVEDIFKRDRPPSPAFQPDKPYFVTIGTIEPRKNQLLLLQVWRELAGIMGAATPKLIVIGARGWDNENVVDLLDRCEILRPFVLEVSGLSTPAMAELVAGSQGLLMPTLAEGFGIPAYEAASLGARVLVSDLPVFEPLSGPRIVKLDPLDGPGWLSWIRAATGAAKPGKRAMSTKIWAPTMSWELHFRHVSQFLQELLIR